MQYSALLRLFNNFYEATKIIILSSNCQKISLLFWRFFDDPEIQLVKQMHQNDALFSKR